MFCTKLFIIKSLLYYLLLWQKKIPDINNIRGEGLFGSWFQRLFWFTIVLCVCEDYHDSGNCSCFTGLEEEREKQRGIRPRIQSVKV